MNTPWQPTRTVDFVLRFDAELGPAMKSMLQNLSGSRLTPEDHAREACRVLARAVGGATHAYVGAATQTPMTAIRQPSNADDDGVLLGVRLDLNVPMNNPVDGSDGNAVAGLLNALIGLPRGSISRGEVLFPEVLRGPGPVLSTINPTTLPGQKLCPYCKNPMPDYEVQCMNCGARMES